MSDVQYINKQEIRRDLDGFLRRIADGQQLTVIYRSKPLVTVMNATQVAEEQSSSEEGREQLEAFERSIERFSFKSDRKYTREEMNER